MRDVPQWIRRAEQVVVAIVRPARHPAEGIKSGNDVPAIVISIGRRVAQGVDDRLLGLSEGVRYIYGVCGVPDVDQPAVRIVFGSDSGAAQGVDDLSQKVRLIGGVEESGDIAVSVRDRHKIAVAVVRVPDFLSGRINDSTDATSSISRERERTARR